MASSYGTRRNSAIQSPAMGTAPLPISAGAPYSPQAYAPASLSSSIGKQKRPAAASKGSARRLSTSTQAQLRPGALSQSVPASLIAGGTRARSASLSQQQQQVHMHDDDLEYGVGAPLDHPHPPKGKRKEKGQTYECEKCSKVYRHSTCLTKHRWEHTEHWKEASKLLLSKHQQVQLLEGAAILAAASAGTSLPGEKSFWPAAVSPPTSGLLGAAHGIHMQSLSARSFGSPRWGPSSLMSDAGDLDISRSELDDIDSDDDDGQSPEPRSGSAGLDSDEQMMEDGMFDLDLGGSGELPPASPLPVQNARLAGLARVPASSGLSDASSRASSRPPIRSSDSGFGSIGRSSTLKAAPTAATTAAVVQQANALGMAGVHAPPTSLLGAAQTAHAQQPAHAVRGFFLPGQGQ
ncbi:hypothetical protein JCM10449v2_000448 [Rhodotorula kratochvilovae]